ncbi:hypothetical protein [Zhongshania borealis]|uniref:Hotdog family protein n=1 Tax=Zhongshania borealis TaxID=889488 RepID=A0ABP7WIP9_9GAMM
MINTATKALTAPLNIEQFIPHDGDMSLLDEIIAERDNGICAAVTIGEHSLFADQKGVPSWVGIEYMGQAIAAYAGLKARKKGEAVKIGFLVSCRRYIPNLSYFPLGARLEISADAVTDGDTGLQIFECQIKGPEFNFCANLNVFMPEDVEQFMQENMR